MRSLQPVPSEGSFTRDDATTDIQRASLVRFDLWLSHADSIRQPVSRKRDIALRGSRRAQERRGGGRFRRCEQSPIPSVRGSNRYGNWMPYAVWRRWLWFTVIIEPMSYVGRVPTEFRWGSYGPHLFFMISGFVIFMTLDRCRGPGDFIFSRFSRLNPLYWVGVLFFVAGYLASLVPF